MHVFHIKGFSGLLLLGLGIIGTLLLVLLVPSIFMMVLWNATIFEGLKGPIISLDQGFYLWATILILLKITLKPELQFQFNNGKTPRELDKKASDTNAKAVHTEEVKPAIGDEKPPTLDNQG